MGTSVRTSPLPVGYQGPGGTGLQVRRIRGWAGEAGAVGREAGSWKRYGFGRKSQLLSLAKAMSPCAETPPVTAAFLSWEPQPGITAVGSYSECSGSTMQP